MQLLKCFARVSNGVLQKQVALAISAAVRNSGGIAVACFVLSCSVETEEKLGPQGSWWLGGADGGVFIRVQDDQNPNDNLYTGTIYFDDGETIWHDGALELKGAIQDFNPQDRSLYEFWDGEKLHLVDSAFLDPVDPVPPL